MPKNIFAKNHAGAEAKTGRRCIWSGLITSILLLTVSAAGAATPQDLELSRFLTWFEGEFDNYEQVWQQKQDQVAEPLEHIHHIFKPVQASRLGERVFFVKQYMDGDYEDVYRQRLYRFSPDDEEGAIRLDIHSFNDEMKYRLADRQPTLLADLEPSELRAYPGCEVFWKWNGEYFDGYMKQDACTFISKRSGKRIFINDTLRLTADSIWIQDQAHDADGNKVFGNETPHKNRKVKFYKGWMTVKKHRVDPEADLSEWIFARIERIHNEGQKIPLLDEAGRATGYTLRLETLTHQDTRTPVLKLGVIEDRTGYTLSYTWTQPGSPRIGLNLRWFQAGLTRIE